ncbi:ulp1 protease family, C-terminal catalytic domain-containing protein [Tanacetum coccineum]|uniref:Ulp1 protease family, C-terminal catalytic domain-containing protein n=1 Tax=Tanacetum coccineum TaxID=301880 RepID=A0ABQ5CL90_9ASTR
MELRLEKGSIKATRQKVQDMLGIPMGSRKLEEMEQRPFNDPFIKEWENQFKHVKKPTPAAIASVISDSTQADFMFRMNFITLFGSTMGTLDNGGRVSTKLLKGITEDVDISEIDWCGPSSSPVTDQHLEAEHYNNEKKNTKGNRDKRWKIGTSRESLIMKKMQDGIKLNQELFNDNEFKLYEYSKDDDSEGETDGDNEDNNHDDDGAPTADANKKKESENQTKERNKEGYLIIDTKLCYKLCLGSINDFIFETKEGNATIRDYMQTLAPTLKIKSNVIDTYCLVLNHEQRVNNKRKKTKHFFYTGMIMEDGKKYDEVKQYKAFSDTMKNEFKKDDEVKKLKDLEMKNMFSMHLKEVQHPRAKEVLNKKPTILRPKWGTEENNTYCGVFLIMHMENYNGENARQKNLEFPTDEEGNRYDIIKMRMRFAAKMLSHEINIHRVEMSKQALEFTDRNKEKKAREALIWEAIRVKKQKQDSERVSSAI